MHFTRACLLISLPVQDSALMSTIMTSKSVSSHCSLEFQSYVFDSFLDINWLSHWDTTEKIPAKRILFPPFIPVKMILPLMFLSSSNDYQSLMAKKKPGSLLNDSKWNYGIDVSCLTSPLLCRSQTEPTGCSLIFLPWSCTSAGFAFCIIPVSHWARCNN